MEIMDAWCGGLAVPAKTVVAGLMQQDQQARRTFAPMPGAVWRFSAWLVTAGCPQGAIARTGVSWQPVCNLRAGRMDVLLVPARHGKAVPGHKTEARARAWLAARRRLGSSQPVAFPHALSVPCAHCPATAPVCSRTRALSPTRSQPGSDSGQRQLGQGARAALGVRGRALVRAWAAGETPATALADVARKSVQRHTPGGSRACWTPDGPLTVGVGGVAGAR